MLYLTAHDPTLSPPDALAKVNAVPKPPPDPDLPPPVEDPMPPEPPIEEPEPDPTVPVAAR